MDWDNWHNGDCVCVPDSAETALPVQDVLGRIAVGFRRASVDWLEGDRWVQARIAKHTEFGSHELIMQAERNMLGNALLVSVADEAGPNAAWVRFCITRWDAGIMELHYEPPDDPRCRSLARKLAEVLGYEFHPWEEIA
jgi:hypothetical protein